MYIYPSINREYKASHELSLKTLGSMDEWLRASLLLHACQKFEMTSKQSTFIYELY